MTNTNPTVTVVMPAHEAENTIRTSIDSVLSQTCPEWELVVVDDGSTDGTGSVVQSVGDPRVRLITQSNRGCSHARNVGMRQARGRYVALLDADDRFAPTHLEKTAAFLDDNPGCQLVGTNYFYVEDGSEPVARFTPTQVLGSVRDGVIADYFSLTIRQRCFPITCGTVLRRQAVEQLGGFNESLESFEDQEFYLRWALRSRFGYISDPLCYYQLHTPKSRRKDMEKSIRMRIMLWEQLNSSRLPDGPVADSFARCRSYYLCRLTALAIAAGQFEQCDRIQRLWPRSPSHASWWLGAGLASLPRICQRAIHDLLGHSKFVHNRYGT